MTKRLFTPPIYARVLISFAVIIGLVIVVGVVGYLQLSTLRDTTDEAAPISAMISLLDQYFESLTSLDKAVDHVVVVGDDAARASIGREADALNDILDDLYKVAPDRYAEEVSHMLTATTSLRNAVLALMGTDTSAEMVYDWETDCASCHTTEFSVNTDRLAEGLSETHPGIPSRTNASDSSGMNQRLVLVFRSIDEASAAQKETLTKTLAQLDSTLNRQGALARQMLTTQLVFAGMAVIFAVGASLILSRSIVRPVTRITETAVLIAQGDYSKRVDVTHQDEVGRLAATFNEMVSRLEARTAEREGMIKELLAAKRLAEENSRLKSEFLSTMSHELRTPMNAIEGFTSIMLNRMGGVQYNEKAERYITRVNANSKRLLQLINDFLDLSRVEAGRLELAHMPFAPRVLAQRWNDEIGVLAEKKGLHFDTIIDPELPATLVGDEEAVSKIALNLLGNAIKFTEEGAITVMLQASEGEWRIAVQDTGIGIPPHAREFIFEEFRQVDQTSKRKFGGTGLGLAIVQKYARSMGGTVSVKSEVGQGSVFTVALPMEIAPVLAEPSTSSVAMEVPA